MQCPKCKMENPDNAAICNSCGHALEKDVSKKPVKKPKTSGLAMASLVLSIFGLLTFLITALLSIALGIASLCRIKKHKGELKGTSIAITGITISAASVIVFLAILVLWHIDAPPIPNDYTIADIHSAKPEDAESFELLLVLNKKEPNTPSESAIGLSEEDGELIKQVATIIDEGDVSEIPETLNNNNDNIEKIWIKTEKARNIIKKLNAFDEIADLTEPNINCDMDYEVMLHNILTLSHLHRAYIYLQIERKNTKIPIDDLIAFDSVIRKLSLNARLLTTKTMCFICLAEDIQTANAIINNSQTSQHTLELLAEHFTPFTEETTSFRDSLIFEYLIMKNITTTEMPKRLKRNTPTFKINSTLRLLRNNCDYCISISQGHQASGYKAFSVWPAYCQKLPNVFIDPNGRVPRFYTFYNPLGSVIALLTTSPKPLRLLGKINMLKIQDDLLQIVLNKRLGKKFNLKARAYSNEYIIDVEKKLIFSPGPDGEPYTKDDIKLVINPKVLRLGSK